MLFEVQAQVQQWLRQHIVGAEEQGDQQPADAPVAIQERMDCLELHVRQRGLDQQRRLHRVVVQEFFELAHAFHDPIRWRRDEG